MEILETHRRFRRHFLLSGQIAQSTANRVESCFKTFLKRTGVETIYDIDEGVLQNFFYEGLEVHQWSHSHYSNHHKYLKKFLLWLMQENLIKSNPIENIKRPKPPKSLPRRLTEEEAKKVLYGAFTYDWTYEFEQVRNHAIIATFLFSGLRLQELLNLELTDVDLSAGHILVRKGKGNKDRYVPIHYKLTRILKGYLSERKSRGKQSMVLFTGVKSDSPLKPKDVYRFCKKISIHVQVRFTPHQLRHTFGSVSVEQGLNIVKLKEMMGHSSLGSTMLYLKMSGKNLKKSLDRLEMF